MPSCGVPTNFRNAVAALRPLSSCFKHVLERLVRKDGGEAVDVEELMALLAQRLDTERDVSLHYAGGGTCSSRGINKTLRRLSVQSYESEPVPEKIL